MADQSPSSIHEVIFNESSKVTRQKEAIKKLQEELQETKLVTELKKQRKELEIQKIKNKFYLADQKLIENFSYKEKTYIVPKFSCIDKTSGKSQLKYLLDMRGKKANWLNLTSEENDDWINSIPQEKNTVFQLNKDIEKLDSNELWNSLQKKGLVYEKKANAA